MFADSPASVSPVRIETAGFAPPKPYPRHLIEVGIGLHPGWFASIFSRFPSPFCGTFLTDFRRFTGFGFSLKSRHLGVELVTVSAPAKPFGEAIRVFWEDSGTASAT